MNFPMRRSRRVPAFVRVIEERPFVARMGDNIPDAMKVRRALEFGVQKAAQLLHDLPGHEPLTGWPFRGPDDEVVEQLLSAAISRGAGDASLTSIWNSLHQAIGELTVAGIRILDARAYALMVDHLCPSGPLPPTMFPEGVGIPGASAWRALESATTAAIMADPAIAHTAARQLHAAGRASGRDALIAIAAQGQILRSSYRPSDIHDPGSGAHHLRTLVSTVTNPTNIGKVEGAAAARRTMRAALRHAVQACPELGSIPDVRHALSGPERSEPSIAPASRAATPTKGPTSLPRL